MNNNAARAWLPAAACCALLLTYCAPAMREYAAGHGYGGRAAASSPFPCDSSGARRCMAFLVSGFGDTGALDNVCRFSRSGGDAPGFSHAGLRKRVNPFIRALQCLEEWGYTVVRSQPDMHEAIFACTRAGAVPCVVMLHVPSRKADFLQRNELLEHGAQMWNERSERVTLRPVTSIACGGGRYRFRTIDGMEFSGPAEETVVGRILPAADDGGYEQIVDIVLVADVQPGVLNHYLEEWFDRLPLRFGTSRVLRVR